MVHSTTSSNWKGPARRLASGIPGLDEILHGGYISEQAYLIRGRPGTGKTTLGMHFIAVGKEEGEKALIITFGGSEGKIRKLAGSMGFDLSGVFLLDLSPTPEVFIDAKSYDLFSPAEEEREPTTGRITETIESVRPRRVLIDSVSYLRYLSPDVYQFRRQIASFLRYLQEKGITVLMTSEVDGSMADDDLQFLSDGVITVEASLTGRSIHVDKYVGSEFREGSHSIRLSNKGMEVFPRLIPGMHRQEFIAGTISSGVEEFDKMLHGGIERGTVTIISGPSGTGKTNTGIHFVKEVAGKGERAVIYTFDEGIESLLIHAESLGIPARSMVEKETLSIVKVEPLQLGPDEFARLVRQEVEERGAKIVMLDSVAGYRLCIRNDDIIPHLHAILKYLSNMGVTVIAIEEYPIISGQLLPTMTGISYIADNILVLRYVEYRGKDVESIELRKVIGVLKKRLSGFEKAFREIDFSPRGILIGQPLPKESRIVDQSAEWRETRRKILKYVLYFLYWRKRHVPHPRSGRSKGKS